MLGDHPISPVLLAKDLAAAREFYHDRGSAWRSSARATTSSSSAAAAPRSSP
jgi:hypothetical protein